MAGFVKMKLTEVWAAGLKNSAVTKSLWVKGSVYRGLMVFILYLTTC